MSKHSSTVENKHDGVHAKCLVQRTFGMTNLTAECFNDPSAALLNSASFVQLEYVRPLKLKLSLRMLVFLSNPRGNNANLSLSDKNADRLIKLAFGNYKRHLHKVW